MYSRKHLIKESTISSEDVRPNTHPHMSRCVDSSHAVASSRRAVLGNGTEGQASESIHVDALAPALV